MAWRTQGTEEIMLSNPVRSIIEILSLIYKALKTNPPLNYREAPLEAQVVDVYGTRWASRACRQVARFKELTRLATSTETEDILCQSFKLIEDVYIRK